MKFKLIVFFAYLALLSILHSWFIFYRHLIAFCVPYTLQPGDTFIILSWFAALIFFMAFVLFLSQLPKKIEWRVTNSQLLKNINIDAWVIMALTFLAYAINLFFPANTTRVMMFGVVTVALIILVYHFILTIVNFLYLTMQQNKECLAQTNSTPQKGAGRQLEATAQEVYLSISIGIFGVIFLVSYIALLVNIGFFDFFLTENARYSSLSFSVATYLSICSGIIMIILIPIKLQQQNKRFNKGLKT